MSRPPSPRRKQDAPGLPARDAAVAILDDVLTRKRALDDTLAEAMGPKGPLIRLEPRDRGFARAIAATTLRRLGQVDAVIDTFLDSPLPAKAGRTRQLLRAAAAELLFLGVGAHATVNAAVSLARADRNARHFAKLVNAILRRVAEQGPALRDAQDAPRLDTPDWLWDGWTSAYGEETASAIATAHLAEPPLDFSVKSDPARWAETLGGTVLPTGSVRLADAGRVEDLEGFAEGAWWVQDAAAALPAKLLGNVEGQRVLDLCAAPGGKTAELAAKGARVTAVDRSAPRLKRVTENLARLGLSAEIVTADATQWRPPEPAPFVLLDAPCSATGTIRRHPDIPHLKGPGDVAKLAALQARLLTAAVEMTAPGGTLVYCTCSLEPAEGEAQIEKLLASGAPVARKPITADEIGGLAEAVTPAGDLRTLPSFWPDLGGMDGFFAARLVRA